jgi:hypothetical protein
MTVFPDEIQTFETLQNITAEDGELIQQYQSAMSRGDIAAANEFLEQIPDHQKKIITADYFNTMNDTLNAIQEYTLNWYTIGYVVSQEEPEGLQPGDFWFQITGEVT